MKRQFEFQTIANLTSSLLAILMFALTPRSADAQCSICPPASTYSGVFSASSTNLSGYHPCLAINGIYDVDVNVTITSSFIYLGPDAQIRVQSGATLTLNDCTIQGCNAMWSRILVNTGGKLVADNCDVMDGIDGFDARGGSEMDVQSCNFTNNYIGIYLRNKFSTSPPTGITFTLPLSNNIFQTVGNLKPPYANQMGYAGIKVQNLAPVNLGETGYPQNQFLNIANGVVSENSRVVVKNALFQSLASIDNESMTGINATGGSMNVNESIFNNCLNGVVSSACNLTAEDNNFSAVWTCFDILNSAGRNVTITDNVMTNTRVFGVRANNNGVFSSFLVERNEIEMDFAQPGFLPFSAVELSSATSITQGDVKIRDNDIDLYGAVDGIKILMNRNTDIEGNIVGITHATGLSPSMEHGIKITSSGISNIVGNTSVVVSFSGGASEIHTIELNNSENVLVCGNTVNASDVGFKFNGQNPNTNFSNNSIGNHKIGVFVGGEDGTGTGSFMGVQAPNNKARDNQWGGTYSLWGAQNINTDLFFIQKSLFSVRNTSQPQMPPSISVSGWFFPNGTGLNLGCPVEQFPDDPGEFEKSIALGTVPFTDYATAQHWRAQTTLYRSLKENPTLLGQDNDVDAFYYNAASGAIGAFQTVADGISGLGVPDEMTTQQYEALESQVATKMGELASIDAQLLTASGTVYDGLVAQRRTISADIFDLHEDVLELDSSVQAARVARAAQLISQNSSITAATLPQQYLKSVNDVYLNTVGMGVFELTSTQVAVLDPIANTCIHEGGDAVLGARELLKLAGYADEYDDDLLCSPPQPLVQPGQGSSLSVYGELSVFPNPAKGQVEIKFHAADKDRVLQVLNQQGTLMRSVVVGEGQTSQLLSLEGIPSGIYHMSIKGGDRTVAQKLVVLK